MLVWKRVVQSRPALSRAKLHQIDNMVEDRMEQLVQSKPLSELFRWLARLNDFREADWEEHIMLLSKAITDKFSEAGMGETSESLGEVHPAHIDMEKVHLRSRVETAELEVDALRMKLMNAEMNQQSFAKLLTERRVDIPDNLRSSSKLSHSGSHDLPAEHEAPRRVVSVAAPDQPAAEPLRQRKLSMYKTHRDEEKMEQKSAVEIGGARSVASTEDGDMGSSTAPSWMSRNRWSVSMGKRISPEELESLSGEALAKEDDPRILKAKIRELETLASAWEQEARDQSTKCLELEGRNKEANRVQRQRDLAMKDVARSQTRIEALEHQLAELQAANAALQLKVEVRASESEDGSRRPSSSRRRTSVDDDRQAKIEKLRSDGDKGRLGLPTSGDNKARQNASSSPERQTSSRDFSSRRTSTVEVQEKASPSRRRLSATEQKPSSSRQGSTAVSRSPAPPLERPSQEAKSSARRGSTAKEAPKTEEGASLPASPSVAEGRTAEPRAAAELSPGALKKELLAQEPIPGSNHVGAASPRSLEEDPNRSSSSDHIREVAAHYFSMYSDELARWTLEGSRESRETQDASTQTLITVGGSPPAWQVWQTTPGEEEPEDAQNVAIAKAKLLQWCTQFIRAEEPDILKLANAMASLDRRVAEIRREEKRPEAAPSPPSGKGSSTWSKAVQRMNRLRNEKVDKSSAYEEERQRSVLAKAAAALGVKTPKQEMSKPSPGPSKLVAMRRAANAVQQSRRWIASPSGAAFCRSEREPMPEPQPSGEESPQLRLDPPKAPSTCNSLVVESRSVSKDREQQIVVQEEEEPESGDTFLQGALDALMDGNAARSTSKKVLRIPEMQPSWPRQISTRSDMTFESEQKDREEASDEASTHSHEVVSVPSKDRHGSIGTPEASPSFPELPALPSTRYEVVAFRHQPVGAGLYEQQGQRSPGMRQERREERWLPEVARGGFSNLDTPSMIAGQLDRFAAEHMNYLEGLCDESKEGNSR
eukprot:s1943_g4.t2